MTSFGRWPATVHRSMFAGLKPVTSEEIMINISKRVLTAASLLLLAGISASCGDSATDNAAWNGRQFLVLEPGVNLAAVPDTIILDPNDASAPRDPVTHKLIGKTTISALLLDANLDSMVGANITFTTTAGTLTSTGLPVVTDTLGVATDTLTVSEDGPTEITVTAASATDTSTIVVYVDIAPVANAGADQTVACQLPVTLDGSASTDANSTEGTNDDIAAFEWFLGDSAIATGEVVDVDLPIGINLVTLLVTDSMGASDTDTVTVTVIDTIAPVVALHMTPSRLWPPNHKMKTVQAVLDIQDCDPLTTVELVSVTSNEPDNGLGDGDTSSDICRRRSWHGRPQRAGPRGALRHRQRPDLHLRVPRDGQLRQLLGRHRDRDRPARSGALTPGRQGRSGRQGSGATRRLVAPLLLTCP